MYVARVIFITCDVTILYFKYVSEFKLCWIAHVMFYLGSSGFGLDSSVVWS